MPATLPHDLALSIADTLTSLSVEIEALGATLCADTDIATRHLDELQGVDRIAQTLGQLADVVGAPSPGDAIEAVSIEGLRDQLRGCRDD
ncbi:MAG: hypothetical protein QNI87_01095 [Erythrobacter sp.]|uniref:hypothetical protein n=1 Tax=Erythrobacter sp. TaxID=1042 RepID=UPI002606E575|nr:hypothetical protein [Erythrobacter sp.]MDJ0977114.1 hypothetical protein [Erythrobacter sp.]